MDEPLTLQGLRKLRGHKQQDLAARMGMTKGGLSQIETSAAEGVVQANTLRKTVEAMGGQVLFSAVFPDGSSRVIKVGAS